MSKGELPTKYSKLMDLKNKVLINYRMFTKSSIDTCDNTCRKHSTCAYQNQSVFISLETCL